MDLSASNIDPSALFVNSAQLQQQMERIANMALSAGIEQYQNKEYKEAAQAFALQATVLFLFLGCFLNSWLLSTIPSHIFAFLVVAFYPIRNASIKGSRD